MLNKEALQDLRTLCRAYDVVNGKWAEHEYEGESVLHFILTQHGFQTSAQVKHTMLFQFDEESITTVLKHYPSDHLFDECDIIAIRSDLCQQAKDPDPGIKER